MPSSPRPPSSTRSRSRCCSGRCLFRVPSYVTKPFHFHGFRHLENGGQWPRLRSPFNLRPHPDLEVIFIKRVILIINSDIIIAATTTTNQVHRPDSDRSFYFCPFAPHLELFVNNHDNYHNFGSLQWNEHFNLSLAIINVCPVKSKESNPD